MGLPDVVREVQAEMRALAGVRSAPDYVPDQVAEDLVIICYPATGTWKSNTPEDLRGLHTLHLMLLVPTGIPLKTALEDLYPYVDLIPQRLWQALKAGRLTSLDTFGDIGYEYGKWAYAGIEYWGYRFTVQNVKTKQDV
jgi:hypothetical protein